MLTVTDKQFAALRQEKLGDGLIDFLKRAKRSAARDPATGDILVSDSRGNVTRCKFDDKGFVGAVEGPLGRTYRLRNDSRGRPLVLSTPSGLRIETRRDNSGRITRVCQEVRTLFDLDYAHGGNDVSAVRFPDNTSVEFGYSRPGRIASIKDRLDRVIGFEYSNKDRLASVTDGNRHTTTFSYGAWSRPDRIDFPDGTAESYEYGGNGHVRRITAAGDLYAEIESDAAGKPTLIRHGDGELLRFAYDERGNVVSAVNSEATVTYKYDGDGRVVEEDQNGQRIRYEYDADGLMTGVTYPDSSRVAFERDAELRLACITDWAGGRHVFAPASDDRGYEHTLPNGLKSLVLLSPTGSVAGNAVRRDGDGAPDLFQRRYLYDDERRLSSSTDTHFGSRAFSYDAEGQLTALQTDRGVHERFGYDAAGNRTRLNDVTAEFDSVNRMTAQGAVRCTYDARGNLSGYSGSGAAWRLHYSRRNLLVRAESSDGRSLTFGYDAFGRRVWKRSATSEVRYVWAGENLIREVQADSAGTVTRDYLYVPGTHTPLALRVDKAIYCYHTDHIGTPHRITDAEGRIAWAAEYAGFGAAELRACAVTNPLRFPGHYCDDETGLHYNRFRYYSPAFGRYLSPDPIKFAAGLNFYAYAENDPVNAIDPLGLLSFWAKIGVGLAAVAVGVIVVASFGTAVPVLLAAGAIAGAVAGGLGSYLDQKENCPTCPVDAWKVFTSALMGAAVGVVGAAVGIALGPALAAAGFGPVGSGGIIGGGLYLGVTPASQWNAEDLGLAIGFGMLTGGIGRMMMPAENTPVPEPDPLGPQDPPGSFRDANGRLRDPDGRYLRDPNAPPRPHSRDTEYPSTFRQSTHDEMTANWTDEGRAQGGAPRDSNGNRIPRDQLTWRDADDNPIPYYDENGNTNLTYNHDTPVVEHWNGEGKNLSAAERTDWYNNPDNLTPMSRSQNSSEGARLGQTFDQDPGPDYSR
ncbi:MAG: hypothetical protein JWM26_1429 [Betaproteobacteria bacterium]|nr:hypothetical protein [Betaproteobacteria bacterium]